MRIFNSTVGDPMLLDTVEGLCTLHGAFERFLASIVVDISFAAEITGDPAPYIEFLQGLRVRKGGESKLTLSQDRWLELVGSHQELKSFSEKLLLENEGGHHHWNSIPVSLIIEAVDLDF
jgi:hypothetical protein